MTRILLQNRMDRPTESEQGISFTSMLTTWDNPNENGYIFDKASFDAILTNYYEKEGFNIPLDLLHNMSDIDHLIGKVTELKKTDEGIVMTAYISKACTHYETIKKFIEEGILQGVSTCGYITETDSSGRITGFGLLSVSLVTTPAERKSHIEDTVENTRMIGFEPQKNTEHDDIEDLINLI